MNHSIKKISTASMTGFARTQGSHDDLSWIWEVKSVNGRNMDIRSRLPSGFESLESDIRVLASKTFSRGNMQLSLTLEQTREEQPYRINQTFLKQLRLYCEQEDGQRPSVQSLLAVRGVIDSGEMESRQQQGMDEKSRHHLLASLSIAFEALKSSRYEEGQRTGQILAKHFEQLSGLIEEAEGIADKVPAAVRDRFEQQLARILNDTPPVPEERIAQEIAILATKADVREELDRLRSHVVAGFELLEMSEPVGRKLDFLCQEFNREANTLCSKSADKKLTETGLALKVVIDQIKEQVQNIE